MHFALLLSQLPHVDDARAQYSDMLVPDSPSRRAGNAIRMLWAAILKRLR
ncbi:MAG TPA: hypothetical protein VL598_11220 [Trinickia sp.]|jgi:hypothetical protein|nr:hypothetical protein [Trinickia sp.]HTI18224.1 hypothetical protein [Trinickia sp.]